jgi:hypothetical protein
VSVAAITTVPDFRFSREHTPELGGLAVTAAERITRRFAS